MLPPRRPQGGGSPVKKTCSPTCLGIYKAQQNKIKSRAATLQKFGLTEETLKDELQRQNNSCLGCLKPLTRDSCCLDHNHRTGVFRGILCQICNRSLGLLKEDPATLRRLMAYLDHDRSKLNIYLIGSLKNSRIPVIGNLLRSQGYDVMDEWFTPGEHADTNWQAYEKLRGRTYHQALRGRSATNNFLFDRSYLDLADVAILVMPAGKSAMLELGYSKGRNKRSYIFLDGQEPDRYDIMPGFADNIFKTEQEMLEALEV